MNSYPQQPLFHASLPEPLYTTGFGHAYLGDALALLHLLPDATIDLVITSPPFPLLRKKAYGNQDEATYTDWFLPFTEQVKRVLKPSGSFVLELGNVWMKGVPVLSLYHIQTIIRLCHEQGWTLIQEFAWYNPGKLPGPAEWVNIRRIRLKDSVSHLWWLAKHTEPKAHWEGKPLSSDEANAPALTREPPTNLLRIAHTESNSQYLRTCRRLSLKAHPARFPVSLPTFFIQGLTDPGDVILDLFAGSNTTGEAAQQQGRKWLAFEQVPPYLATSSFRFLSQHQLSQAASLYAYLCACEPGGLHLDADLAQINEDERK